MKSKNRNLKKAKKNNNRNVIAVNTPVGPLIVLLKNDFLLVYFKYSKEAHIIFAYEDYMEQPVM